MKHKNLFFGIAILTAALLTGCAQEDISIDGQRNNVSRVEKILKDFCRSRHTTRGESNFPADVQVTSIETKHYVFDGRESHPANVATRSDAAEFDLSCAEFIAEGKRGFAMVSDTPGIEGVYLYTPCGSITDTICNKGLLYAIETLRDNLGYDVAQHCNWGLGSGYQSESGSWLTDKCITNLPYGDSYYTNNKTIYINSL